MARPWWRIALILLLALSLGCSATRATGQSYDATLRQIARPYRFSIVRWHLAQLAGLLRAVQLPPEARRDPALYVQAYIAREAQARALERAGAPVPSGLAAEIAQMRPVAERIIAQQVSGALREEDIYTPLDRFARLSVTFPPLWFVFEPPPHLLVVSPRERIEPIRQILLVPVMEVSEKERIEAQVEALGLSAMVTEIGGVAMYPAVVATGSSLTFAIETVAEEWLHQYLAFTPLGFDYVLHLLRWRPNHEVAQLNESLATIFHQEIGDRVLAQHYGVAPTPPQEPVLRNGEPEFDFIAFMRETRLQAEALLARGEVEEAEAYMEARRVALEPHGFRIRKLNQAYFAFYGTYADAPGAITPVGDELRALRDASPSLSAFINKAASLNSRDELLRLLDEQGVGSALLAPAQ